MDKPTLLNSDKVTAVRAALQHADNEGKLPLASIIYGIDVCDLRLFIAGKQAISHVHLDMMAEDLKVSGRS